MSIRALSRSGLRTYTLACFTLALSCYTCSRVYATCLLEDDCVDFNNCGPGGEWCEPAGCQFVEVSQLWFLGCCGQGWGRFWFKKWFDCPPNPGVDCEYRVCLPDYKTGCTGGSPACPTN